MSGHCNQEMVCKGKEKDSNCFSHSDCDAGMFCRKSDIWPFPTTCSKMRSLYDECLEDYECENSAFCWYPDKIYKQ